MGTQNNPAEHPRLPLQKRLLVTILRTFFKLLYHQFAWTYDWVASFVSLGEWNNWVRSVVPLLSGPKILEIGFGTGHLQAALLQQRYSIFGMDESTQMVRLTYRRLTRLGYLPLLLRGGAGHLPFAHGSFNQVVMTFPAEFLLSKDTYTEIKRVLTDGGTVIILPVAWITGRKPLERIAAWLNRVTGEAPVWNEKIIEPFTKLGFDVNWDINTFSSSKVLIIKLTKSHDFYQD